MSDAARAMVRSGRPYLPNPFSVRYCFLGLESGSFFSSRGKPGRAATAGAGGKGFNPRRGGLYLALFFC